MIQENRYIVQYH